VAQETGALAKSTCDDGGLAESAPSEIASFPGLPFLGVLLALRRNPLAFFSRLLREHGDRVQFRVLGRRVLLLCHPADLEQVLVKDREVYGRSAEVRALRPLFGQGLLASEGALWKRQRAMIQPSFHHQALSRYASLMLECIARQVSAWRIGTVCDIHAEMMRYTRETICAVLFGSALTASNPEIGKAVSVVFGDLRTEVLYLSLWRCLPLGRSRRWNRAVELLNRSIRQVIDARRASGSVGEDLLGALLSARDAEGKPMADQQLHDEILTFFLAGHETAALALTWTAYLLAVHPEVQENAQEELVTVTKGESVKAEHYGQLRYLTAVVKEAMRLYPPVWSLGRQAVKAGTLGTHAVSEGTDLWLCIHHLHRDARWYSQPNEFRPERWLKEEPQRAFTYLPFGIGPRLCMGQHFAMMETVLGLATMLRQFRWADACGQPPEVNPWITLRPKQRIQLRLLPAG
jgi:cytochrome P450